MVGVRGFEPLTSAPQTQHSTGLSYTPIYKSKGSRVYGHHLRRWLAEQQIIRLFAAMLTTTALLYPTVRALSATRLAGLNRIYVCPTRYRRDNVTRASHYTISPTCGEQRIRTSPTRTKSDVIPNSIRTAFVCVLTDKIAPDYPFRERSLLWPLSYTPLGFPQGWLDSNQRQSVDVIQNRIRSGLLYPADKECKREPEGEPSNDIGGKTDIAALAQSYQHFVQNGTLHSPFRAGDKMYSLTAFSQRLCSC